MAQRPVPRRPYTPTNIRNRGRGGTPYRPNSTTQRKKIQFFMNSDSSYTDFSSSDDNMQVVKVAGQSKNSTLLSDYSSEDDNNIVSDQVHTKIKRQENSDDSYSDSYSSENLKKKSNEVSFAPQKNFRTPIKSTFVRNNIRSVNHMPSNVQSEKETVPQNSNENHPNHNSKHVKRPIAKNTNSNSQPHPQGELNSNNPTNPKSNSNNFHIDNTISHNEDNASNPVNTNNDTAAANVSNSANLAPAEIAPSNPTINNPENATTDSNNNNINDSNNNNINNSVNPFQINNNSPAIPTFKFEDDFHHYTLTRELGKFGKLKTHLFTDQSKVFFHSKDIKNIDHKTYHYFIGENSNDPHNIHFPKFSPSDAIGYIKWNKKLTSFTLFTNQVKSQRDDRQGELMGVYVDTNSANENIQHGDAVTKSYLIFNVVIPLNMAPTYPVSKRLSLSEVAKGDIDDTDLNGAPKKKNKKENKNENSASELSISQNENNYKNDDQRFMRLVQSDLENIPEHELGSIFYQKSVKNFAFIDEKTGKPVFLFFRSSKNAFSIKIRPPMLPLQGHALAATILKRNMQWKFV